MNKFIKILKNDIPQFDWDFGSNSIDSIFGSAIIEPYEFRNESKDFCINGNKYIFISDVLYGDNPDKSFRYCICWQKQLKRYYRTKKFHEIEINKIYVSGKTVDEIYDKLKNHKDFYQFIVVK